MINHVLLSQVRTAVVLLENAAHLLAAADRDGPRGEHAIAGFIVGLNKQILRKQGELMQLERELERAT